MKRTILGALLFLILAGEPAVGISSGLFTPPGAVVFAALYVCYFLLFDALVLSRRLNNLQMAALNFALYSVLITGLLHGELRDYVLHPHNDLITTLIRIQSALFPLFVYALLRRFAPTVKPVLSLNKSLLLFIGFVLVLSLSRRFGIADVVGTFKAAPLAACGFTALGLAALLFGLKKNGGHSAASKSRSLFVCSCALTVVALVPNLVSFLVLVAAMIIAAAVYLSNADCRSAAP